MKKNTKIIIMTIMIISAIAVSILPSFAYTPTYINITFADEERENQTFTNNIYNEWGNIGYIVMDYNNNGYITISVAASLADLDGATIIYKSWLPTHYYAEVEFYASGDDNTQGYLGYNGTDINNTVEGAVSPDAYHQNISITIYYRLIEPIYDLEQYLNYGTQRYNQGQLYVQQNPNTYNLYTAQQYQQNGTSKYNEGYNDAIGESAQYQYTQAQYDQYGRYNYDIGKSDGMEEAYKTSRTLISLFNVGMTGIERVFNDITSGMGIFGTSLAAVIATGIIIMVVFLIYKAIRS